jgi:hypothetical protein
MARTSAAKEEIQTFLNSGEPGRTSELTAGTLKRAAEGMFTSNGQYCPVKIVDIDGQTYLLNREIINRNGA